MLSKSCTTVVSSFLFLFFAACGGSGDDGAASAGDSGVQIGDGSVGVGNDSSSTSDGSSRSDASTTDEGAPVWSFTDVTTDGGTANFLSLAIDTANDKLLVASADGVLNYAGFFRCNFDGSACTFEDIPVGPSNDFATAAAGKTPSLAIDSANAKLLIAADNAVKPDGVNGDKLALYRCNLDGSACTYADISSGAGASSAFYPSLAIDAANAKLLVVTQDGSNGDRSTLFRCNLDGTSCAHVDISAGAAAESGIQPKIMIDTANNKLLVATTDGSNAYRPAIFRCDLDGTSCTYTDVSAGAAANSGLTPSLAIDAANGKLLVATYDASNSGKAALFRCNLDATSCTYSDISSGAPADSADYPALAIDAKNGNLLLTTLDYGNLTLGFIQCRLDATGCTFTDIPDAPINSGVPSAAFDSASNTLFIAAADTSISNRLELFSLHH